MPYKSPEEVAEKVRGARKLSDKQRRQFLHVFNSCWDRNPGDDAKCHAQAWGTVKKFGFDQQKVARELTRISSLLVSRERPLADFANVGPRAIGALKKRMDSFDGVLGRMLDDLEEMDSGKALAYLDFEDDLVTARREKKALVDALNQFERSWLAVEAEASRRKGGV